MPHGPAAPYLTIAPSVRALPVVLSSPHSGRCYPAEILAQLRLSPEQLRVLVDGPVDELLARACAAGATLIAATYPRAVVDLNRDAREQDPESLEDPAALDGLRATLKARAGLGVVPTRLLGEPIYAGKLAAAELERRIERAHRPYHEVLAGLVADQRRRFGASLVLDCHSMPTLPPAGGNDPPIDVALGDRYGRSCHPQLVAIAERTLAGAGLRVARNRPYAGGHITERHGRPAQHSHALQLELRRSLFMDERSHAPHEGLARLQHLLGTLVEALGAVLLAPPLAASHKAASRGRALMSA